MFIRPLCFGLGRRFKAQPKCSMSYTVIPSFHMRTLVALFHTLMGGTKLCDQAALGPDVPKALEKAEADFVETMSLAISLWYLESC